MEELQNEPILSKKKGEQHKEKLTTLKKAIHGICLVFGIVLIGRSSNKTTTTYTTTTGVYYTNSTLGSTSNDDCVFLNQHALTAKATWTVNGPLTSGTLLNIALKAGSKAIKK